MSHTSRVLLRAFSEEAEVMVGAKKWRKLVRRAHSRLVYDIPENGVGPEIAARREAAQILSSALRLCLVERRRE